MQRRPVRLAAVLLVQGCVMALAVRVAAEANTWTGEGDWHSPTGNWSLGHVPLNGESVVIAGNVTLSQPSAALHSYVIDPGYTHTFDGWGTVLSSEVVTVKGTVTHAVNNDTVDTDGWTPNARVRIVCSNLSVVSGGTIDVSSRGYLAGPSEGSGYGPGRGIYFSARAGGGGYGGRGGYGANWNAVGGAVYGLTTDPNDPGSGGGNHGFGGNGGGLIRIQAAGTVTVNGALRADGGDAGYWGGSAGGGGSGGGISIVCRILAGTNGVVSADGGGSGELGGAGGGGRIALFFDTVAQSNFNLTHEPGVTFAAGRGRPDGGVAHAVPGTVHVPNGEILPSLCGGRIHGFTEWRPANLSVVDSLSILTNGFRLNVASDLTITDGGWLELRGPDRFDVGGELRIEEGSLTLDCRPSNVVTARIGGGLVMATGGTFYVYSAMTNANTPKYGAAVQVGGELRVAGNSWIVPVSHDTNGGSAVFCAKNITLADGDSGINANGRGYRGGNLSAGYGPGGGPYSGSRGSGGGHGGAGGVSLNGLPGGGTNDCERYPAFPGSGGGDHGQGGWGGGLVRLAAENRLTLNGVVSADGSHAAQAGGDAAGGGAGGGIYLMCRYLYGSNAVLSANGGIGSRTVGGGGGGGGRIAVWRVGDRAQTSTWSVTVNGGIGGSYPNSTGAVGTVFWGLLPRQALLLILK